MLRDAAGPLDASILVEALRAIPAAFLGLGLIAHALLWAVATYLAEPSPPPQMAISLALGREWLLGYPEMPPLGPWISEALYGATHSTFVLRLLASLCVALSGWLIFLVARRMVGDRHAAIAVLVMVSVFPVAFPGGAFTNDLIQMPLVAATILFWWMAVGERNPNAWMLAGLALGVSLYAGIHGIVLFAVLFAISLLSARARSAIARFGAVLGIGMGLLICAYIAAPRAVWLWSNGIGNFYTAMGLNIAANEVVTPLRMLGLLLLGHFGFLFLVFLATAYAAKAKENAPVFIRESTALFSRRSVLALAALPAIAALAWFYIEGVSARLQLFAPFLMLAGLAAVISGGEKLVLRRQVLVGSVALIFLIVPPVMNLVSSFVPGWLGDNRTTNWPAATAARTFTEIFQTRTGRALEFIAGDRVLAAQIAALSADRPRLVADADPARSPWLDSNELKQKGGVVFWEIRGADSAPPASYVANLPAFTTEAPLRLPWARGGGDPVRLGWAILPPAQ